MPARSMAASGVSAADDGYMTVLIERSVAMRTEGYAMTDVLRLALDTEPAPRRSGGYYHGWSDKRLATLCLHYLQRT